MAYVIATQSNAHTCFIQWALCHPEKFQHEPLLREAAGCGKVQTVEDLANFLDGTRFFANLDSERIRALLEINRCLAPYYACPSIYWECDGAYFMIEFKAGTGDMYYGYLPDIETNLTEQEIADSSSWEYMSIKSML